MIDLSLSENCNEIPSFLEKAVMQEINRINRYPANIETLEKNLLSHNSLSEDYDVFIGNGLDEVILVLMMLVKNRNGEVLYTDHTFNGYAYSAHALNVKSKSIPLDNMHITTSVIDAFDTTCSAIFLCNPHNPCGTKISVHDLHRIVSDAYKRNILVILDETYIKFVSDREYEKKCREIFMRYENVIELHTFSKYYGLAGLRIGYFLAHKNTLDNLDVIKKALPFRINRFACSAAEVVLRNETYFQSRLNEIIRLRGIMYDFFEDYSIEYLKTETNFILIKLEATVVRKLLEIYGIKIRDCNEFELNGYYRLSIGSDYDMNTVRKAIESCLM